MKVEAYRHYIGYRSGAIAPKCSNCIHAVKTKGLRCMEETHVKEQGGFMVRPDGWCPKVKVEGGRK